MAKVLIIDGWKIEFVKEGYDNFVKFFDPDGHSYGRMVVDRIFGNWLYKELKRTNWFGEDRVYYCFLDFAIANADYDSYSDTYKELNNVRPHYTQAGWNKLVSDMRRKIAA